MEKHPDNFSDRIKLFFSEYERRFNDAMQDPAVVDVDGFITSFADFVVGGNHLGVSGGRNDEQFRTAMSKGFDFYKSIGTKYMRAASLDISPLDAYHAMVKVHWDSRYQKKDGAEERIEFDVIYFLQIREGAPKIFAYITGDEEKALKEHGIT